MTRTGHARRRAGRSVLFTVSAMLIGSGLIRLGNGTGLAVAREVGALAQGHDTVAPPAPCQDAPDIGPLLVALQDRDARLTEAEQKMNERRRTLNLAEEEIRRQLAALERAEARLKATVALADEAAEGDIARLTAVYENMKAKDAAALFEEMAPDFAAGFLGRMRADAAAEIMAGLSPAAAYTVSVILAGRNAAAPTD
ncbi:MotE family protein [Actibacterium sp. D379-3]